MAKYLIVVCTAALSLNAFAVNQPPAECSASTGSISSLMNAIQDFATKYQTIPQIRTRGGTTICTPSAKAFCDPKMKPKEMQVVSQAAQLKKQIDDMSASWTGDCHQWAYYAGSEVENDGTRILSDLNRCVDCAGK